MQELIISKTVLHTGTVPGWHSILDVRKSAHICKRLILHVDPVWQVVCNLLLRRMKGGGMKGEGLHLPYFLSEFPSKA